MDIQRRFNWSSTATQVLENCDLTGKTYLITGSTNGIGLETARALAKNGAEVIVSGRSDTTCNAARKNILEGNAEAKIDIAPMNLLSLQNVKEAALKIKEKYSRLDGLILNAGVYNPGFAITEDGFEITFQVNHLSHFYLVLLLEKLLQRGSRIVILSSTNHSNKVSRLRLCSEFLKYCPMVVAVPQFKFCDILSLMPHPNACQTSQNGKALQTFGAIGTLARALMSSEWNLFDAMIGLFCKAFPQTLIMGLMPDTGYVFVFVDWRFSLLNESRMTLQNLSPNWSIFYSGLVQYNNSKLCNVLHGLELGARLSDRGVAVMSLHPGVIINTGISKYSLIAKIAFILLSVITKSIEQGAATTVYCATAPELSGIRGQYFQDSYIRSSSAKGTDRNLSKILWDLSVAALKQQGFAISPSSDLQ